MGPARPHGRAGRIRDGRSGTGPAAATPRAAGRVEYMVLAFALAVLLSYAL